MDTGQSLTLTRRINAAPAKVFAAWADPKQLASWMGPERITIGRAETDVRVGGRYLIAMRENKDSDENIVTGVYREVVPNERLVFTWAWRSTPNQESLVTITLKPDGAGTLLTLKHEQFADKNARDHHEHGWIGSLDKLEKFVA